jgi:hypothetical protein
MTNGPLPYTRKQLDRLADQARRARFIIERAIAHDDMDLSRAGVSCVDDYISRALGALDDLAQRAQAQSEQS